MKILLDSNILVYAFDKLSSNHEQARKIVEKAICGEIEACISAQVLYEFFAVITNPKKATVPMDLDEAADLCSELWECSEIEKISSTELVPSEVFRVAKEKKLSGAGIFDCVLAVTAKENGIDTVYTENVRDFKHYGFIKVINPLTTKQL